MRKLETWLLATALAIVPLTGVQAATTWDLFAFTPVTHPITVQYRAFADEVKKRSNGDLVINVRPAGELPFKATEVVKATGEGQVQLGQGYAGFLSGSAPLASIGGMPMLIRTPEEAAKVAPIIDRYTQKGFEKNGVRVLFQFLWPAQNVFGSGKPVRTIDDFAGRKLRTADPKQAEMLKRLGGSAVTLTLPEVPVAMERGVMDAMFTAGFNVMGAKWYEFIRWAWLPDVSVGGPDYLLMNIEAYNKLSPATRKALDDVAREWGPKMTKNNVESEAGDLAALRDKHKVELIVPPKEQVDRLTDRMRDYWTTWGEQNGPDGVAMVKEIRAALGK